MECLLLLSDPCGAWGGGGCSPLRLSPGQQPGLRDWQPVESRFPFPPVSVTSSLQEGVLCAPRGPSPLRCTPPVLYTLGVTSHPVGTRGSLTRGPAEQEWCYSHTQSPRSRGPLFPQTLGAPSHGLQPCVSGALRGPFWGEGHQYQTRTILSTLSVPVCEALLCLPW